MMIKVFTGGPFSEITRSVYKQVRLLSITNPDTLEKVREIFSENNESYYTPGLNFTTGHGIVLLPLDTNKSTHLSTVKGD
jgi:hypothetical protein